MVRSPLHRSWRPLSWRLGGRSGRCVREITQAVAWGPGRLETGDCSGSCDPMGEAGHPTLGRDRGCRRAREEPRATAKGLTWAWMLRGVPCRTELWLTL